LENKKYLPGTGQSSPSRQNPSCVKNQENQNHREVISMKVNANIGGKIYPRKIHKTTVEYSDGTRQRFNCISVSSREYVVQTCNGIPVSVYPLISFLLLP